MIGITKSIHPMYKESVVLSISQDDIASEGVTHFTSLARTHFLNDFAKAPSQVEVIKEDDVTHVIARSNITV